MNYLKLSKRATWKRFTCSNCRITIDEKTTRKTIRCVSCRKILKETVRALK